MSAGDIDWTGWSDAYGWRAQFDNSSAAVPQPLWYGVDSSPGTVTYCRRHPGEKIAEFTTHSGWMKDCPICASEARVRMLIGAELRE